MNIQKKIKTILLLLVISTLFISCKDTSKTNFDDTEHTSVFYLIRHAEKDRSDSTNKNPFLTTQGIERTKKWAVFFKNKKIDAVYSTNYKRTRQTALPIAKNNNLEIISYTPKKFITEEFIQNNKGKHIVIVGHSNTTPQLVNRLLGEKKYEDIPDGDNNDLFIVTHTKNTVMSKREKVH